MHFKNKALAARGMQITLRQYLMLAMMLMDTEKLRTVNYSMLTTLSYR